MHALAHARHPYLYLECCGESYPNREEFFTMVEGGPPVRFPEITISSSIYQFQHFIICRSSHRQNAGLLSSIDTEKFAEGRLDHAYGIAHFV